MSKNKAIKGFSKFSKEAKIEWITNEYLDGNEQFIHLLKSYWHGDSKVQIIHDDFIENTITNFYIPFGVAPNFLINDKIYCIPMAIEESSVVCSFQSASFWMERGGFKSTVISTTKLVMFICLVWLKF